MHIPGADPPVRPRLRRGVEAALSAGVEAASSSAMRGFATYLQETATETGMYAYLHVYVPAQKCREVDAVLWLP